MKRAEIAFELLALVLAILVMSFLWRDAYALAAASVALFFAFDRAWHKPGDYLLFTVGGILGGITESMLISQGAWGYANPTFFGIPVWLPPAWGFAIVLVTKISKTVSG